MTLILKLDLDIVSICTKNEIPSFNGSKVIAGTDIQADRNTDRQTDSTENITYPHTRMVKIDVRQMDMNS